MSEDGAKGKAVPIHAKHAYYGGTALPVLHFGNMRVNGQHHAAGA